jgi:hypothetical protein
MLTSLILWSLFGRNKEGKAKGKDRWKRSRRLRLSRRKMSNRSKRVNRK